MASTAPSIDEWRRLYEAAEAFGEIRSWEWMSDSWTFGVRDPITGTIAYCSVMGALGELYGLAAYLGAEGLHSLQDMLLREPDYDDINLGMDIRSLMATFQSRGDLRKADLEVIRKLGLSFRGTHIWPLFRSYEPGLFPWFLTQDQAAFLTLILQQATNVCLRTHDDPNLLLSPLSKGLYLVRMPEETDEKTVWHDQLIQPEQLVAARPETPIQIDELRLIRVRDAAKAGNSIWDADVFYAPACVSENPKSRPYYPFMCLWVDHHSQAVLAMEMAEHDKYRQAFVDKFIDLVQHLETRPREIRVKRELAHRLYQDVAAKLGIPVRQVDELGALERIQTQLASFLEGR